MKNLFLTLVSVLVFGLVATVNEVKSQETEPTTSRRYNDFLTELMKNADTNRDGVIDKDEVVAYPRAVFQNADLNDDGLITGIEILKVLSKDAKKTENAVVSGVGSEMSTQRPNRMTISVLQLPHRYARSQVFSLKDIYQKLSVDQLNEKINEESENGIKILDQLEFGVVFGDETNFRLGAQQIVFSGKASNRQGVTYNNYSTKEFGTFVSVKPWPHKNKTIVSTNFDATYLLNQIPQPSRDEKNQDEFLVPVKLQFETKLNFSPQKNVSAVNMLVSGYHLLVIFKIE